MSILANLVCTTLTSVKASIWIRLINFLNFQAMIVRNVWYLDDLKIFFSAPHAKASLNNCSFHCIGWPETTKQILTQHQISVTFFCCRFNLKREGCPLLSSNWNDTKIFLRSYLVFSRQFNPMKRKNVLNKFICNRIILNIDWLLRNDCFPLIC